METQGENDTTVQTTRDVDNEEPTEETDAPKTGAKRAAEDDAAEEAPKKAKVGRGRPKKVAGAAPTDAAKKKKGPAPKKDAAAGAEVDPNKKGRGRPRKEEGAAPTTPKVKAPKKEKKPRTAPNGTGVGSRTRSAKS